MTVGEVPLVGFVGDKLSETALDEGLFLLDKIGLLGNLVPRFEYLETGLGLGSDIKRIYQGGEGTRSEVLMCSYHCYQRETEKVFSLGSLSLA